MAGGAGSRNGGAGFGLGGDGRIADAVDRPGLNDARAGAARDFLGAGAVAVGTDLDDEAAIGGRCGGWLSDWRSRGRAWRGWTIGRGARQAPCPLAQDFEQRIGRIEPRGDGARLTQRQPLAVDRIGPAHAHLHHADVGNAELLGGSGGQIDQTVAVGGPAIVDADEDGAPGVKPGDFDIAG